MISELIKNIIKQKRNPYMKTLANLIITLSLILFSQSLYAGETLTFHIPKEKAAQVNAFFNSLHNGDIDKVNTEQSTKLLQKFNPDWKIVISLPMGKNDVNPKMLHLKGPYESYNLVTGESEKGEESKCFLINENNLWVAYMTYHSHKNQYRSLGLKAMEIDLDKQEIRGEFIIDIFGLFPFLRKPVTPGKSIFE